MLPSRSDRAPKVMWILVSVWAACSEYYKTQGTRPNCLVQPCATGPCSLTIMNHVTETAGHVQRIVWHQLSQSRLMLLSICRCGENCYPFYFLGECYFPSWSWRCWSYPHPATPISIKSNNLSYIVGLMSDFICHTWSYNQQPSRTPYSLLYKGKATWSTRWEHT